MWVSFVKRGVGANNQFPPRIHILIFNVIEQAGRKTGVGREVLLP